MGGEVHNSENEVFDQGDSEYVQTEYECDSESSEGMFDSDDERIPISSCYEQVIQYPAFIELTDNWHGWATIQAWNIVQ